MGLDFGGFGEAGFGIGLGFSHFLKELAEHFFAPGGPIGWGLVGFGAWGRAWAIYGGHG